MRKVAISFGTSGEGDNTDDNDDDDDDDYDDEGDDGNVDGDAVIAGHYQERAMPSAGLVPFLQTFVCGLGNKCHSPRSWKSAQQAAARYTPLQSSPFHLTPLHFIPPDSTPFHST